MLPYQKTTDINFHRFKPPMRVIELFLDCHMEVLYITGTFQAMNIHQFAQMTHYYLVPVAIWYVVPNWLFE